MTGLKRCVAVINNRSGHRHGGVHAYSDTIKHYMNRSGIVHHDIHIPNEDMAENLGRMLPNAEALIICGGDGTVNSAVNLLASLSSSTCASSSSPSPPLLEKPLLLVPTGLHNSIAVSLGVVSAERAISSLVIGRTVRVPLWAVHLRSPPHTPAAAPAAAVRYMCSYIAVGTYAAIVRRQARWKEAQEEYVSLPALLGTLAGTSLYTTVEHASPHCTVDLSPAGGGSLGQQQQRRVGPLRMLVAAQLPQLQAGYSLTPTATYHQGRLTVTTATDDVTRLRMWHLLRREAREGYVLEEDGVAVHEGMQGLRIEFPLGSAAAQDAEVKTSQEETSKDDSALLVLDGECVRVPHGSVITVTPTDLTAQFIVS